MTVNNGLVGWNTKQDLMFPIHHSSFIYNMQSGLAYELELTFKDGIMLPDKHTMACVTHEVMNVTLVWQIRVIFLYLEAFIRFRLDSDRF